MKRLVSSILASSLILSSLSPIIAIEATSETENPQKITTKTLTSGSCGTNATYSFDASSGTLTISGSGDVTDSASDFDFMAPPWDSYSNDIKSVVISEGITSYGRGSFYNMQNLSAVSIPGSVTLIRNDDFQGCAALSSLTVSGDNQNYSSVDGVLFDKNKTKLIKYPQGKTQTTYEIPSSVTTVGSFSFQYSTSLTTVSIPNSVTVIEEAAFSFSEALTSMVVPNSVKTLGSRAFWDCTSLTSVVLSESLTRIEEGLFDNCTSLNKITIPNSVTSIGYSAFMNCTALTNLTIPNSVTSIEESAFMRCTALTELILPDSITKIQGSSFSACFSLSSVVIPDSVTSIDYYAFLSCRGLKSMFIPASVVEIGNDALHDADTDFMPLSDLLVYGFSGSYAETWCNENNVPFQAVTSVPDWANLDNATTEMSVIEQIDAIKAKLPYTGDISKMRMSAAQALAMAEEIESFASTGIETYFGLEPASGQQVALFDVGDGTPAMLEYKAVNPDNFYDGVDYAQFYWNTNKNSLEEFQGIGSGVGVNVNSSGTEIWFGDTLQGEYAIFYADQYQLIGGDLKRVKYEMQYFSYKERVERSQVESEIQKALDEHDLGPFTINWDFIEEDEHCWYATVSNGALISNNDISGAAGGMWRSVEFDLGIHAYTQGDNWGNANTVASLLRQYAELAQFRFQLPEYSQNSDITSLFDQLNLSGTLLECYEITDHFYYVIMEENGVEKGYLICAVKENGEVVYKIVYESTEILTEDALLTEGNQYAYDSNILLQFELIKDFVSSDDYVSYFRNALENITGMQLNDQGKSELALLMQDSIVNFATYVKNLGNETGEIHQGEVAPLVKKSNSLYQDFLELLRAEQAELNKELEQTVRVVLQGLDEKNWTIYLNPDLIDQLEGNHLQVFLSSGQQGVEISAEDLDALLKAYDGLFINVQETGMDQYSITFADGQGNDIEKLENTVKIYLPTSQEFSTVILEYAQGTENWGGQFNAATNTIQFSTVHSGTYLIVDNSVEIFDVSEEYLSMVQFMVSKGFFALDDNGNFNPYGSMTRNDFTKTIVSMFFALDHDLKSSFPDVFVDSPYYSYIASGEAKNIVAGYDDGYFYGDVIITEEMVFSSIARTLVDKKGYIYPEDVSFYLNSVSGGNDGSDWSAEGIALAVRDAIVLPSDSITPTGEVSRQDAAVYLYRLFMLLEEKQQINFELVDEITLSSEESDKNQEKGNTLLYVAVAGGIALAGGAFALKGKKPKDQP